MEMVYDEKFYDLGIKGKSHDDTEIFDDSELLGDSEDVRIAKIRVWYGKYVHGIQTVYETSDKGVVETPLRMGPGNNRYKLKFKEVALDRKEFIIGIYGMHGKLIDYFEIRTNTGRKVKFGESKGSDTQFGFKIPKDHYAVFFKGGYGGHIHNLGCYITEVKCPLEYVYTYALEDSLSNNKTEGPTHKDTKVSICNQALRKLQGQHRITKIGVYYRSSDILGLKVKYNGMRKITTDVVSSKWSYYWHSFKEISIEPDNYITNIYGYCEKYLLGLVIETHKGGKFEFGNTKEINFNSALPDGMQISCIEPGLGKHIHNLTLYYGPVAKEFKFHEPALLGSCYSLC